MAVRKKKTVKKVAKKKVMRKKAPAKKTAEVEIEKEPEIKTGTFDFKDEADEVERYDELDF